MFTPLARRPKLLGAICIGIAAGLAAAFLPGGPDSSTAAVIGWNVACLWFSGLTIQAMRHADETSLKKQAAIEDEGRHAILGMAIVAVAASFAGVAAEFLQARHDHGALATVRIVLAVGTVVMSWLFTQLVFAVHYAHEFYGAANDGDGVRGGLKFPGTAKPRYGDFFHFAAVIGVANQTADVQFTSRPMRTVGTIHGIVAFVFNTAVLALMINLAAGLFGD